MYASARGLGARASDATEVYPVWNLHYGWLVGAMLSKLLYEFSLTIYSVCIASIMRMTTLTILSSNDLTCKLCLKCCHTNRSS